MDFRAVPPRCRQGIGRIHAGQDIIYEGEILDLGSGLIDYSQKMTAAAMQIAEK